MSGEDRTKHSVTALFVIAADMFITGRTACKLYYWSQELAVETVALGQTDANMT